MAEKQGKNSRKPSKLSKVKTWKLTEILSRKLAYHPGQTQHYEIRSIDVVTSKNAILQNYTANRVLKFSY